MTALNTGGRRTSRAVLDARRLTIESERGVERKRLARAAREAEKALELRPTLRLVLSELVGCFGEPIGDRLLVWPSNEWLMERTGLSERAIRYALKGLAELRLITPRDSANGKRYAVRDDQNRIRDAYGFDLTPLIAREAEFAGLVLARKHRLEAQSRLFDAITIARRATEEALASLVEHYPAVPAADIATILADLRRRTPRRGSMMPIAGLVAEWSDLRMLAEQRFYDAGNGGNPCRHKETDNDPADDSCEQAPRQGAGGVRCAEPLRGDPSPELIRAACPALATFGHEPRDAVDLVAAGRLLRGSIGAHESAWLEACDLVGPVRAACAVIYVLQLHHDDVASGANRIRNPGGYFRSLVRMIAERRLNLELELMTLRRKRLE